MSLEEFGLAPDLYDARTFDELMALNDEEGFVAMLFENYLTDAETKIQELKQILASSAALSHKDLCHKFREVAHSVKSCSLSSAARGVAKIFEKLQEMGDREDLTNADAMLLQGEQQFNRTKADYTRVIQMLQPE
eukprot:EC725323.1.p1 GENE.EC725323.1~~EC725323.1.p1  ORF type:complete len:135 (+),score=26.43 EC725323.1:146-550(+)